MSDEMSRSRPLRSRAWFDNPANPDMTALYIERYLNYGLTREELQSGKPINGIAQTGNDLSPCNRHHIVLAQRVRSSRVHLGLQRRLRPRRRHLGDAFEVVLVQSQLVDDLQRAADDGDVDEAVQIAVRPRIVVE